MAETASVDTITIGTHRLRALLREVVREVVREELQQFVMSVDGDWEIEAGSAIWEDLTMLKEEMASDTIQYLSHAEVFGE